MHLNRSLALAACTCVCICICICIPYGPVWSSHTVTLTTIRPSEERMKRDGSCTVYTTRHDMSRHVTTPYIDTYIDKLIRNRHVGYGTSLPPFRPVPFQSQSQTLHRYTKNPHRDPSATYPNPNSVLIIHPSIQIFMASFGFGIVT